MEPHHQAVFRPRVSSLPMDLRSHQCVSFRNITPRLITDSHSCASLACPDCLHHAPGKEAEFKFYATSASSFGMATKLGRSASTKVPGGELRTGSSKEGARFSTRSLNAKAASVRLGFVLPPSVRATAASTRVIPTGVVAELPAKPSAVTPEQVSVQIA